MAESLHCPECEYEVPPGPAAPMQLGLHRRRVHGIPGKTPTKSPRKRDTAPRAPRKPPLSKDLRRVFSLAGTVVEALGDAYCGRILAERSGPLADALGRLASEDERIARWLSRIGSAGPYGALVIAAAEVVVPIAAHHGLLGPGWATLTGAPPIPSPPEPETSEPVVESENAVSMG